MPPRSRLWLLAQRPAGRERVRAALVAADGAVPDAARALRVSPATLHEALRRYLADLAPLARAQPQGRQRRAPTGEDARRAIVAAGSIAAAARRLGVSRSALSRAAKSARDNELEEIDMPCKKNS